MDEEQDFLERELRDIKNVEDIEEDESTSGSLYAISSFGVDYPVDTIVNRIDKGLFYIPDFQRKYVWSQNQASRFIESLLLGLPVPGIFLFKEPDTGKHLVIDGQQRLKTLAYFYEGLFRKREFKLTELKTEWNGLTYKTLDEADKARLGDAVVHATVFKQDLPEGSMNSVYEVFERINTGGVKLSPQEIRSCIFHGKFHDLLHELNTYENWRAIFGPESARLKDIELILRFFAFLENRPGYERPMKHFLNEYMKANRTLSDQRANELRAKFHETIDFIHLSLGDRCFRPDRALNTAVYDSVTVGVAERLLRKGAGDPKAAKRAYDSLLKDKDFQSAYTKSTAGEDSVSTRMQKAIEAFANI